LYIILSNFREQSAEEIPRSIYKNEFCFLSRTNVRTLTKEFICYYSSFFFFAANGLFVFVSLEETYPPMTNIWINVYNAIWSLRLIRRLRTFLQILSLKRRRRWDNSNIVCARVTPQRIVEQRDLNNGIESNKCVRKSLCVCASVYIIFSLPSSYPRRRLKSEKINNNIIIRYIVYNKTIILNMIITINR